MKAFSLYQVIALATVVALTGCRVKAPSPESEAFTSPAESFSDSAAAAETPSPADPAHAAEPFRTDDIELRFAIPTDVIDGFIIYYGFSADALTNEVRVPVADLETVEQAGQGKVYRYFLRELPAEQPLFVSLAAFRGEAVSPKTDVVQIDTGEPKASVGTTP